MAATTSRGRPQPRRFLSQHKQQLSQVSKPVRVPLLPNLGPQPPGQLGSQIIQAHLLPSSLPPHLKINMLLLLLRRCQKVMFKMVMKVLSPKYPSQMSSDVHIAQRSTPLGHRLTSTSTLIQSHTHATVALAKPRNGTSTAIKTPTARSADTSVPWQAVPGMSLASSAASPGDWTMRKGILSRMRIMRLYSFLHSIGYLKYYQIVLNNPSPERQQLLQRLMERYTDVAEANLTVQNLISDVEGYQYFGYGAILYKSRELDIQLRRQLMNIRACALHASEARYLQFLPRLQYRAREIQDRASEVWLGIFWNLHLSVDSVLYRSTRHDSVGLMVIAEYLNIKAEVPLELGPHGEIHVVDSNELWILYQQWRFKRTQTLNCTSYYVPREIELILEAYFECNGKLCPISSSKQQLSLATMDELLRRRGTEDV